jgi:glucosamine-6-phosphate deaminase
MTEKLANLNVKGKLERKYEKLYTNIFDDSESASIWVAEEIASLIRNKSKRGETCVLGLATGSSPIGVYKELVRMHKEEGLSFKNVVTFNLDEYYPMEPTRLQSYVYFMNDNLFNHIDIPKGNINIPDGTIDIKNVYQFCQSYEQKILSYGGIDLQLLGIGRTGHIGFNEPGSGLNSPTRLISLDTITMADAAGDFHALANVPRRAITMGVGTIMNARKIFLMAWGEKKASIIQKAIEGPVTDAIPTTFLQAHPDIEIILDNAAAEELTRIKTPWLVHDCEWDTKLIKKASIWLCQKLDKPVLKLTDRDYNDTGLSDLLANHGPAYKINIDVFNKLQHTITGWPGGKPNADDTHRPERAKPHPKKVLVFSPHPDDDVLAMGGTLMRLVEQGHKVHVAYQTSGNIAVPDDDVLRFVDFAENLQQEYGEDQKQNNKLNKKIKTFLKNKKPGDIDIPEVRNIKRLIREGESKSACRFVGIPEKNIHFLEMPFYETGTIKKAALSDIDTKLIVDLLKEVEPHQVYAAGDLTDPHGTHRKCLTAIFKALDIVKKEKWASSCWVWLYRGAWQEWDTAEVDMAVPLSPDELLKKRNAIFRHRTQKELLFPGKEQKEIWRYSIERNKATADLYNKLGMAEYEAIEAFVRHEF